MLILISTTCFIILSQRILWNMKSMQWQCQHYTCKFLSTFIVHTRADYPYYDIDCTNNTVGFGIQSWFGLNKTIFDRLVKNQITWQHDNKKNKSGWCNIRLYFPVLVLVLLQAPFQHKPPKRKKRGFELEADSLRWYKYQVPLRCPKSLEKVNKLNLLEEVSGFPSP